MLRQAVSRYSRKPRNLFRELATSAELQEARPFTDIPAIPSIPILGAGYNYLPFIGKYKFDQQHHAAKQKYEEYGPIIREEITKRLQLVHVFNVEDFQKVWRNEGRYPNRTPFECIKAYREKRKDLYANSGILHSNGEEWYKVRSQVQPHMMKPKAIHVYLSAMDELARKQVDRTIFLRQDNGEVKDYLGELYKWALESVGLVALDARLGCLDINPKEETINMIRIVNELFEQLALLEFSPLMSLKYINTLLLRKFTKNMDDFSETVHKYLLLAQKRLEDSSENHEPTFLQNLLSTTKEPRDVFTMINDMFFAGIDTTSTTVALALYHLARNPAAQEEAYREVKRILPAGEISVQTLNDAKYIKACVKESMRLASIVGGNLRILTEDIVLSGYLVPAGQLIVMNSFIANRLEKNFPEPLTFRPERFLREQSVHDPFAFLPFGFGTRSCIGRRIAEQEIWTLMIRILDRFRVEYHHGDVDLFTRIIFTPNKKLDFKFCDR